MKTSLWESEDAESLNETNWGEAVALVTDGENYPNRYFLEAYPGAKTGTYTFLFFPNGYDESDIETVGAVKAQKDKIFAECTVEFTDKDIEPVQKHQVIVGNGTGSGEYAAGDIVTITAAGAVRVWHLTGGQAILHLILQRTRTAIQRQLYLSCRTVMSKSMQNIKTFRLRQERLPYRQISGMYSAMQ